MRAQSRGRKVRAHACSGPTYVAARRGVRRSQRRRNVSRRSAHAAERERRRLVLDQVVKALLEVLGAELCHLSEAGNVFWFFEIVAAQTNHVAAGGFLIFGVDVYQPVAAGAGLVVGD